MSNSWETRLAGWFEKRHWRVLAERTGTVTLGGVRIVYDKGVFDIDPPGVFISPPLGTRGRHGVSVIEVDSDGRDIPGTGTAFGETVLRRASEAYGTITGLPEKVESLCPSIFARISSCALDAGCAMPVAPENVRLRRYGTSNRRTRLFPGTKYINFQRLTGVNLSGMLGIVRRRDVPPGGGGLRGGNA